MSRMSKFRKSAWAEDAVSLGITGVSPHVERTGYADRLWYPGGRADERRHHDARQHHQRTE